MNNILYTDISLLNVVYFYLCLVIVLAIQLNWHPCKDDLTTKRCFDLQATWVIDALDLFF